MVPPHPSRAGLVKRAPQCPKRRQPGGGLRVHFSQRCVPGFVQGTTWGGRVPGCESVELHGTGRSLTGEKKKCSGTSLPKKACGHSMCSTMVGGGWRLAVGGGWRLAVGNWRLVAVGGGWRRLVVGDWWLVAVGSGWQFAVGGWSLLAVGGGWWLVVVGGWRLAVGGGWRLMGVGGWRLVVPWGGP